MSNNGLTKNYSAEAAIPANRFVKPGAADFGVLTSAAVGDFTIGITTEIDALINERVDVIHAGIADLKLGATVVRGALLTSDATGRGVTAVATNRYGAVALISGVVDDLIPVVIAHGTV